MHFKLASRAFISGGIQPRGSPASPGEMQCERTQHCTEQADFKKRQSCVENRCVVAKWEGCGGGMDWEFGIRRCKLLYIKWINNKVILCSTGNYIQYPVINHNGKEYEKECRYMYN